MPWLETDPMNERKRFILEATAGLFSHSELCRHHDISRKTGYKWLERYETEGPDGLLERSHRPHCCPHATDPHILEAAFELRRHRPRWGAAKILGRLLEVHPDWSLPAPIFASACVWKRLRSRSSHSSVAKKLSQSALSYASPTEPIEGRTPTSLQRSPNAIDVYSLGSRGRRNSTVLKGFHKPPFCWTLGW